MTQITLPKRPELSEIVPLSSSPDGKMNSYCMRCESQGQSMHYAACLWRQDVLSKPDIRHPSDWTPCKDAAARGECVALMMRSEEVSAEQSIFFRRSARENHPLAEPKRSWVTSSMQKIGSIARPIADAVMGAVRSAPPPKPRDAIDAMSESDGYASAINAMIASGSHVTEAAEVTKPVHAAIRSQPIAAMPGESPLAMARRIAAARANK